MLWTLEDRREVKSCKYFCDLQHVRHVEQRAPGPRVLVAGQGALVRVLHRHRVTWHDDDVDSVDTSRYLLPTCEVDHLAAPVQVQVVQTSPGQLRRGALLPHRRPRHAGQRQHLGHGGEHAASSLPK